MCSINEEANQIIILETVFLQIFIGQRYPFIYRGTIDEALKSLIPNYKDDDDHDDEVEKMLMMILIKPWNIVHSSFQHQNKIMKRRKCLIRNLFRRYILLYLRVCGIIEGVTLDIKSMHCTESQERKSHIKANKDLISRTFLFEYGLHSINYHNQNSNQLIVSKMQVIFSCYSPYSI